MSDIGLMSPAPASTGHAAEAPPARMLRPPVFVLPIAATIALLAFLRPAPSAEAVVAGFTAGVLVILAAIDIEHRLIPNRIVLPAAGLVLAAQLAFYPQHALEWAACAFGAALVLLIPNMIRSAWMGMGDVKLMLLIGAALGWSAAGALLLAFLCVFPVALAIVLRGGAAARKTSLPFGPFLALGALIMLFTAHLA
jgi:leader peptidase (prepilin peptidase) / N-methyltransferase